jgi:hypothetical protein
VIDLVTVMPFQLIFHTYTEEDPEGQMLRNWLGFKIFRILLIQGDEIISTKGFAEFIGIFYEPKSRQDRIAQDNTLINIARVLNLALSVIISIYFMGLLWYRLSDYLVKTYLWQDEPEERFWIVAFELRRPRCEQDLGDLMTIGDKLVKTMYFMLTTLSTVGYGDQYPISIGEKFIGCLF